MENLKPSLRVFIGGVMQGSRADDRINDQGYRQVITQLLQENLEGVEVIDPWALYPNNKVRDMEQARLAFLHTNILAQEMDLMVAYLPEASMGTAVEIWEAYRAGVPIFSISPMQDNWVIRLFSSRVFPTLEAFKAFITNGGLGSVLRGA
jgi:hypothetical protein